MSMSLSGILLFFLILLPLIIFVLVFIPAAIIIFITSRRRKQVRQDTNDQRSDSGEDTTITPPSADEPVIQEDKVSVQSSDKLHEKSFAEILRDHRTSRRISQEYVAEQLNVTRQAVSKWENGTSEPSTANLIALAKLYGISLDELVMGTK